MQFYVEVVLLKSPFYQRGIVHIQMLYHISENMYTNLTTYNFPSMNFMS